MLGFWVSFNMISYDLRSMLELVLGFSLFIQCCFQTELFNCKQVTSSKIKQVLNKKKRTVA